MSEPRHREFWIDDILNVDRPNQKTAYIHEQDTEKCHRAIHVIEYPSYAELQEKLKVAEEALEELANLMDDVVTGEYKPDSFTTQTSREALAKIRGEG